MALRHFLMCFTLYKSLVKTLNGFVLMDVIDQSKVEACDCMLDTSIQQVEFDKQEVVEEYAYAKCYNLEEVKFHSDNVRFGKYVFHRCFKLKKVENFPAVKEVPDGMFSHCINLKDIQIKEGTQVIGDEAFGNCVSLKKVVLPSTCKLIKNYAFDYCIGLEELHLPKDCKTRKKSFVNCRKLKLVWY